MTNKPKIQTIQESNDIHLIGTCPLKEIGEDPIESYELK